MIFQISPMKPILSFKGHSYLILRSEEPARIVFFCTNNSASKSIILACIIFLYEKLKNYSIQSFKHPPCNVLYLYLLLKHISVKIHYTNYFSCKTISFPRKIDKYFPFPKSNRHEISFTHLKHFRIILLFVFVKK